MEGESSSTVAVPALLEQVAAGPDYHSDVKGDGHLEDMTQTPLHNNDDMLEMKERLESGGGRLKSSSGWSTMKSSGSLMAVPADAPIPKTAHVGSAWDRTPDPTRLQANSSRMVTVEDMIVALEPFVEAAAFRWTTCLVDKSGVKAAKRRTIRLVGRDTRHVARRAGMFVAALRDGNGWKTVVVKAGAGERAPLYDSADKSSTGVKTEIAVQRLVQELRRQRPQTSWRLHCGEGVVLAGYQHMVKIEAESS